MKEFIDDISIMREYSRFREWVDAAYGRYDFYCNYEVKIKLLPEMLQRILISEKTLVPKHLTPGVLRQMFTNLCAKRQPKFHMDEACATTFDTVIMYLREDPKFISLGNGYSLEKGLLLCGKVGCGKTLFSQGIRDLIGQIHLKNEKGREF